MRTNFKPDNELASLVASYDDSARPLFYSPNRLLEEYFKKSIRKIKIPPEKNDLHILRIRMEGEFLKYAKWIRFNFVYEDKGFTMETNLGHIIRTNKGLLYGHSSGFLRTVLYTTHAIERFQDRVSCLLVRKLSNHYYHIKGRKPSPLELLDLLIVSSLPKIEFGITKTSDILINAGVGIVVLERKGSVYIAKTFLKYEQIVVADWYKIKPGVTTINSFDEIFSLPIGNTL